MKRYNITICFFVGVVLLSWTSTQAVVLENRFQPLPTQPTKVEISPFSSPLEGPIFCGRPETIDSFERANLSPWTTSGYSWGIRDTMDQYGPNICAFFGYRYAGVPSNDISVYLGGQDGILVSPTIDLTGWDSLFISFNYWGDFEGEYPGGLTNFDGGEVEISSDNGTSWRQIDSLARGHLNPTYDDQLAGGGSLGSDWAYCWDTGEPPHWVNVVSKNLISLGYVATGNQLKIRFHFSSDELAGGQGWFIDDVRIATTPPPDLQPPLIIHTPLTDTPDTLNPYLVSATITDVGSGVNYDSVYLHYQIEGGPITDVRMDTVGTGSPDIYQAQIPAQYYHTDVYYYITALDLASPANKAITSIFNFEVTNARTIQYDDGQPYWVPGGFAIGDGLFMQFSLSDVGIDSGLLHQVKFYFSGPGQFDLRIYRGTTGPPGTLLGSIPNLNSPGYQWYTLDITNQNIQLRGDAVVGYIIGPGVDTAKCLLDPTEEYGTREWGWVGGTWQQDPFTGGDPMIRLKVIPITFPGITETDASYQRLSGFSLGQAWPNPMKTMTNIEYQLPTTQKASLLIYNATGQLVRQWDDETIRRADKIVWDGRDEKGNIAASGVYFYELSAGGFKEIKKMVVVR